MACCKDWSGLCGIGIVLMCVFLGIFGFQKTNKLLDIFSVSEFVFFGCCYNTNASLFCQSYMI